MWRPARRCPPRLAERYGLDPAATPANQAWALLYEREPELYDRLVEGENLHPRILAELPIEAVTVLDVGAGSGRLTLPCAARAAEVLALEPAAGLRRELAATLPRWNGSGSRGGRSFPTACWVSTRRGTCAGAPWHERPAAPDRAGGPPGITDRRAVHWRKSGPAARPRHRTGSGWACGHPFRRRRLGRDGRRGRTPGDRFPPAATDGLCSPGAYRSRTPG